MATKPVASGFTLALVTTAPSKYQIPEVPAAVKLHVWKIGDEYFEDINKAREAMTNQLIEQFFKVNDLTKPADIAQAMAENLRRITRLVDEALK